MGLHTFPCKLPAVGDQKDRSGRFQWPRCPSQREAGHGGGL